MTRDTVDNIAFGKNADNGFAIDNGQGTNPVFGKPRDHITDTFVRRSREHIALMVGQYRRNLHRLSPYVLAPDGTYSIRRPYQAMTRPSRLDDPEYANFAWRRYWRLMRWMFGVTLIVTVGALGTFWWQNGMVSIHFFIATAGAITGAIMLTAALMGLVFLSSGSGHDESIDDPFEDEADR